MKYYLIIINIFLLILYGIDKLLAIKHKERISEFALIFISLCGGSIGGILGMIIFHHKTKKDKILDIKYIIHIIVDNIFFRLHKNY